MNTNPCLTIDQIRAEVTRCLDVAGIGEWQRKLIVEIGITLGGINCLGMCRWKGRHGVVSAIRLQFSRALWATMTAEGRLDTVRHEAAHAIDAFRRGTSSHDRVWKSVAREVGARPERLAGEKLTDDGQALVASKRVPAHCGCGAVKGLSRICAKRLADGKSEYTCNRCKGRVRLGDKVTLPKVTLLEAAVARAQKAGCILAPAGIETLRKAAVENAGTTVRLTLQARSASMPEAGEFQISYEFDVPALSC